MALSSSSLAAGIASLARREGATGTRHPGVSLYRFTTAEPPTRYVYPASLVFAGAGRKQISLGNRTLAYDARRYLVVTSPMPILCRTIASVGSPVLSMVVEIELALLRELILDLNLPRPARPAGPATTVFCAPLSRDLEDAAVEREVTGPFDDLAHLALRVGVIARNRRGPACRPRGGMKSSRG